MADKQILLNRYKLTLAPENSLYEGYVTEKPIHSFLAGTMSLYRGGHHYSGLDIPGSQMFLEIDNPSSSSMISVVKLIKSIIGSNAIRRRPLVKSRRAEADFCESLKRISDNLVWICDKVNILC